MLGAIAAHYVDGGGWEQVSNEPGSTFTGWTVTANGTWSSDGTVISVSVGSDHSRALRTATAESLEGYAWSAVEAEVLIPASGFVGNGSLSLGVCIAPTNAGAGGVSFRFDGNNQVRIERDAQANIGTAAYTITAGTWYRVSLLVDSTGVAEGYVNGTKAIGPLSTGSGSTSRQRGGLYSFSTSSSYRNFKAWRSNAGSSAPLPF